MAAPCDCVVIDPVLVMVIDPLKLNLDVDASRKIETHQRINCLRSWVDDVNEALMCAHLEMLAAIFIFVRRANHAIGVLLGR